MSRRAVAALRGLLHPFALAGALAVALMAAASPAWSQAGPVCTRFGASSTEGWGPCPTHPNIAVSTSNVGSIGGAADWFLKLTDQSGVSAACTQDAKYIGNWLEKIGKCGEFCFDVRIFAIPHKPLTVILPSFSLYGPSGLRADFHSNVPATTDTGSAPGWHRICAPVRPTQPGENLPSGPNGTWKIAGSNAPNAAWNQILGGVTRILLPIDYTAQPSEVAGYDNICMNPGVCEQPPVEDPPAANCLTQMDAKVKCNPDGSHTVTMTGVTGSAGTEVTLVSKTAGVVVTPDRQPWASTMTWTLVGATAGQAVQLAASATTVGAGVDGADLCCNGEVKVEIPKCEKPVDVKIEKTGGTSPAQHVKDYSFALRVFNVGAGFTGANTVVVTDVVPAGMTFASVSGGSDWACAPATVPAGGTLTCTYVGPGPTAPGQMLGAIMVNAVATGNAPLPPVTNCATVGFTPSSGRTDANPADNTSCVTVSKPPPPDACPPPQIPGPVLGTCICPAGTTLQGRDCVKTPPPPPPQACAPPLVPGPIAGSCVCPAGTTLQGRECVRTPPPPPPQACAPPLVPGPIAGSCVCPAGTTLQGRECVKTPPPPPPQACAPPFVPGPVAGSCVCPQGTVQQGRECVRRPPPPPAACAPPLVPGPVAGSCVCPQGTVQQGRECVKPPPQGCTAPFVPGPTPGSCVCPQGMVQQGRECVSGARSPGIDITPRIFGPAGPFGGGSADPRDRGQDAPKSSPGSPIR